VLRNLALSTLALIAVGSVGIFTVQTFWRPAATTGPTGTPGSAATSGAPALPGATAPSGPAAMPGRTAETAPFATPVNPANTAGAAAATPNATATPDAFGPAPPTFDVVRIDPLGAVVTAGRSAPGAEVSILADGVEIGHTTATGQGTWVVLPEAPLPPGAHTLTLQERTPAGQHVASQGSVLMTVPDSSSGAGPAAVLPPLAVLTTPQLPPRLLQGPPGEGTSKPGQLGLGALDYDAHGDLELSGTAAPGTTVRLYSDDQPVGEAQTGKDGRWSLIPHAGPQTSPQTGPQTSPGTAQAGAPGGAIAEGPHQLRLDEIGPNGKVSARVELPFRRDVVPSGEVAAGRIVVQPGTNLWRIAHRAYGSGLHYTVIYQANRDQIRNPDLIYPGQVLAVPEASGSAGSPASSKTSR
jgi:hypothetical protein